MAEDRKILEHVVDRYGITEYAGTTLIAVNTKDAERAVNALMKENVTHREFNDQQEFRDEMMAEQTIVKLLKEDQNRYVTAVEEREGLIKYCDDKKVTIWSEPESKALSYLAAKKIVTLGEKVDKTELPITQFKDKKES